MGRRQLLAVALLMLGLGVAAPPSASALGSHDAANHGPPLGQLRPSALQSPNPQSTENLTYHGGPVMHTNTTYAIYWTGPSHLIPASYSQGIDAYFQAVAADSGTHRNVYSTTPEYGDASGVAGNRSSFGGSFQDTNPLPTTGCTLSLTPFCVSDAQIRSELDAFIAAHQLPRGLGSLYFVFLPAYYGSCYSADGCSYTKFCAYHSWFGTGTGTTLFANMPWNAFTPAGYSYTPCGTQASPNGNQAVDREISSISHEHIETVTDPTASAWTDGAGEEIADKCGYKFGAPLGSTAFDDYNQEIGLGVYEVQLEWSNASGGCVGRSPVEPPPPPVNDNFAQALILTGTAAERTADTNFDATKETGEPAHAGNEGGASVWYRWTAPRRGGVTIDTSGSGFDTLLAVYKGSSVAALTSLAAAAGNWQDPAGAVSFAASPGATYEIAVDGFNENGSAGGSSVQLRLHESAPPNTRILRRHLRSGRRQHARLGFRLVSKPAGAHFECKLDQHRFRRCGKRISVRAAVGRHILVARAIDPIGVIDPTPARTHFVVPAR